MYKIASDYLGHTRFDKENRSPKILTSWNEKEILKFYQEIRDSGSVQKVSIVGKFKLNSQVRKIRR